MFKKKNGFPPFSHRDICQIAKSDPGVEIPWSEVESGHWVATCQCGQAHHYEPAAPRVQLDPYDLATSRHAPQCEFKDESDPAVLKVLLKVRDAAAGDAYWWVECGACEIGWQVPHFAEERV